jgi:hypothetical protein
MIFRLLRGSCIYGTCEQSDSTQGRHPPESRVKYFGFRLGIRRAA